MVVNGQSLEEGKQYVGLTDREFKERYNSHLNNSKSYSKCKRSELSKHLYELNQNNQEYKIHWRKVRNADAYSRESGKCKLCLGEKVEISNLNFRRALNKRTEIFRACPHKRRHYLQAFDPNFPEEQLIHREENIVMECSSQENIEGKALHREEENIDQYNNLRRSTRLKNK